MDLNSAIAVLDRWHKEHQSDLFQAIKQVAEAKRQGDTNVGRSKETRLALAQLDELERKAQLMEERSEALAFALDVLVRQPK